MARAPLPPVAAVISFIDCINRTDLDGITALMTDDHHLKVLDEEPLVGRDANRDAWHGYFTSFPNYVIYPRTITADGVVVTVVGNTTGSHLGLPDEAELKFDVTWVAEVVDGRLRYWHVRD